jgi:hypothetical protein
MGTSPESGSGLASATDSAESNTPHTKNQRPSSALDTPRTRRRTEVRQPKGCEAGIASPDARVGDSLATVAGRRRGRLSSEGTKEIQAARSRVATQRRENAKRIRIQQIKNQFSSQAWALRQRTADLEREAEEETARLARVLEEKDKKERSESEAGSESTAMEEDRDDDLSNHSYAPTEVYSDSEQECWTRAAPPTQQQQGVVALHRHHAISMVIEPEQPQSFITVTREVQGINDTGSPVQRVKQYRVRPEDLESLHSDSDMEEL